MTTTYGPFLTLADATREATSRGGYVAAASLVGSRFMVLPGAPSNATHNGPFLVVARVGA